MDSFTIRSVMKNSLYYITAAIPYVNGQPHIGHGLEFVQADTIARYYRLLGKQVIYLSGADENGLKMVQAAEKQGLTVQKLCDVNAQKFQDLFCKLNTTLDIFQRATAKNHQIGSQKLWQLCVQNGDIYKKKYKGLYCVGCEAFYTEDELTNGQCPEHLIKPEIVEEENYFFRLSKYQDKLLELIESDKLKIIPQIRKNEVLSFIKQGLTDFSISRSRKRARHWGIPVPGDNSQIIYIWFDALNVYQTGIGFGSDEKNYQKWWPAAVHVIGKGIIRFHTIYWPAILMSTHLKLPKSIFVHGYINSYGQKMSKSLGNVVDPFAEIERYGTDPVRYYLLSQIPPWNDGDYNDNQFRKVYNADLANGIGNVVARVAKLCEKSAITFATDKIEFKSLTTEYKYHSLLSEFRFNEALEIIWQKIKKLDQRINREKPWEKLKASTQGGSISDRKDEKLKANLTHYVDEIRQIACLVEPFLPETATKIKRQFSGKNIKSEAALFPRLV